MIDRDDLPLDTKYRPETFDKFLGNDAVIESLRSILAREKGRKHSFLFHGPPGCGKTTLAGIVRKELGCVDREFRKYNTANTRGIDTAREIVSQTAYAATGGVRVFLFDECHKLTNEAQNALLDTLENCPPHIYFILCTTEPLKLLSTIRDNRRCASYKLATLQTAKIVKLLDSVCTAESVQFSSEILRKMALASQGSPGRALVILDKVIDVGDDDLVMEIVGEAGGEAEANELARMFISDTKWSWSKIRDQKNKVCTTDADQVRRIIYSYLSKVLDSKGDRRIADMMVFFEDAYIYVTPDAGLRYSCFRAWQISNK